MIYNMKKVIFEFFALILTFLAIVGVNSACNIVYGQPKEPKTLERYKKTKY